MSMKVILSIMKKLNLRRGRGGLSATVWCIIQVYIWVVFWKNPTIRKSQSDEQEERSILKAPLWQKARLAKTVLATSTWRRILELERRDLDVVWKLSRSARYSGLFVVSVLNVWRAILNLIREATGLANADRPEPVWCNRASWFRTPPVPVCWWLSATCWGKKVDVP